MAEQFLDREERLTIAVEKAQAVTRDIVKLGLTPQDCIRIFLTQTRVLSKLAADVPDEHKTFPLVYVAPTTTPELAVLRRNMRVDLFAKTIQQSPSASETCRRLEMDRSAFYRDCRNMGIDPQTGETRKEGT